MGKKIEMDYHEIDNDSLALLAKTDKNAMDILWNRTQKICYMNTKKYFNYINDSSIDGEDLLQESFFGFYNAIQKFDINKGVSFNTFISRHVWNSIRKQMYIGHKKNQAPPVRPASFDETVELYGYDLIGKTCKEIEEVEDKIFIEQIKKDLTKRESFVFDEIFKNEISGRELGKRLGISGAAVSDSYRRALKKIERNIEL